MEEIVVNPASTKTMNLPVNEHVDKLDVILKTIFFLLIIKKLKSK